jgi:hypothetical protein
MVFVDISSGVLFKPPNLQYAFGFESHPPLLPELFCSSYDSIV